jgi:hypothetical protein
MRKKLAEEYPTKAKKRDIKKRPRMNVHGRSLLIAQKHGGKKVTSR